MMTEREEFVKRHLDLFELTNLIVDPEKRIQRQKQFLEAILNDLYFQVVQK